MSQAPPGFLAHQDGDTVAVAVRDLPAGEAEGGYLRGPDSVRVTLTEAVPLGHKFALTDIADGEPIIEYGVVVAQATAAIGRGDHVHVHNVRSVRWQNSVA